MRTSSTMEAAGLSVRCTIAPTRRSGPGDGPGPGDGRSDRAGGTGRPQVGGTSPAGPHGQGHGHSQVGASVGSACYLGDDTGDLTAFRALDQLADCGIGTARIAVPSDEAPAE